MANAQYYMNSAGMGSFSTVFPPSLDTIINSAVDGNSVPIPNGGSTTSNTIQIRLDETDNMGTSTFECSLNGQAFSICGSSPVVFDNLVPGKYVLQIRAKDTIGNTDLSPVTFTWTIGQTIHTNDNSNTISSQNPMGSCSELIINQQMPRDNCSFAASFNNLYLAWSVGDEDKRQIFFIKSIDGGNTFGSPILLSKPNPSASFNPQIAADGKNVYIVWQDDDHSTGNQDIYFTKSIDGGNTFGSMLNLSNDAQGSGDPQIAIDNNNVYVVWGGTTPGSNEVYFTKGINNGDHFSKPIILSNEVNGISFLPKISLKNNDIQIIWLNKFQGIYHILIKKSYDGGINFGSLMKSQDTSIKEMWKGQAYLN